MGKKSLIIMLFAVSAVTFSTAIIADGASSKGFYVNGGLGYGKVNAEVENKASDNSSGFVYSAGGGYQFDKYVALEGGYTHYPDVKVAGDTIAKRNSQIYAAVKGILPLKGGFNVFAKAGAARVSTTYVPGIEDASGNDLSGSHSKILPYGGVGFGYLVSHNVDFNIQFAGTPKSHNTPAMYAVMAGVSYKF